MHSQSVVELRSCTKIYVILDLETHFVCNFALILDSPLKLASRQQPRYFTTQNCFILLLLYVMLSAGRFFSHWKECIKFYLPKMNWQLIINKPLAPTHKYLVSNIFDLHKIFKDCKPRVSRQLEKVWTIFNYSYAMS